MSLHVPFNLEELTDILASSGQKTFWFVIKKLNSDFYYLKKHNPKTNASVWTKNYMNAMVFHTEVKAQQYFERYFKKRKDIWIGKGEVKF